MMKRLLILLCLCITYVGLNAQVSDNDNIGVIWVKLKPTANTQVLQRHAMLKTQSVAANNNGKPITMGVASLDKLNKTNNVVSMRRLFPHAGKYETKHEKHGLHLWYELKVDESKQPRKIAQEYGVDSNIEFAQPVYKIKRVDSDIRTEETNGVSGFNKTRSTTPNDPDFEKQWHYNNTGQSSGKPGVDIGLLNAWEATKGNPKVIVSVVDGGIDVAHEDLKDNMWPGLGRNFVYGMDPGSITPTKHGTHVAGTIAASNNNGAGVCGIAGGYGVEKGVQLMSCQVFTDNDRDQGATHLAMIYGADNGAVISQNSWGYEDPLEAKDFEGTADCAAINYFIAEAGTDENGNPRQGTPMVGGIVIFAAGNDDSAMNYWYPAAYDKVMAVASVNNKGQKAVYSNYGDWVDISAPGGTLSPATAGGVYSTLPGNSYGFNQGTSMACPHVSGVAALILSKFGGDTYTPDMLWDLLVITTTSLEAYEPQHQLMGAGLVNAGNALRVDEGIAPDAIADLAATNIGSVSAQLNWTAPTDADNSKANSYQIAASQSTITETNFASSAILKTLDAAQSAGSNEIYKLTDLAPLTKWYVAVRSLDRFGNISLISNVIDFTTIANGAPEVGTITPLALRDVGEKVEIDLSALFTDPEGDAMTFTVNNPNTAIAEAIVVSNMLTVTPKSAGEVIIAITAKDVANNTASGNLKVTVSENRAPVYRVADTTITDMTPRQTLTLDLSKYFNDPDGDAMTYSVSGNTNGVVNTSVSNSTLTIVGVKKGDTSFDIIATDKYGASDAVSSKFNINISISIITPKASGEIAVFPIPVQSILNYSFVLDAASTVEIRVYAPDGRIVYHKPKQSYAQGGFSETIDTSLWSKGLYILQYLVNGKSVDSKKIVK